MVGSFARMLAAIVAALILSVLAFAVAVLEGTPRVAAEPADGAAAAQALDLFRELRGGALQEPGPWQITERQIDDALAAGARLRPGAAARAHVGDRRLRLEASLPLATNLWLNASVAVAESGDGLALADARLGRVPLPPALALAMLRRGLDLVLGDGLGTTTVAAVAAVRTEPPTVTIDMQLDAADQALVEQRLRAALAALRGGDEPERVLAHLGALHAAVEAGDLPRAGSVLPYLRFAVEEAARAARDGRGAEPRDEMRAGLLALALYCGDERFGTAIGVSLPHAMRGQGNGCRAAQLAERADLRKHFAVSAGLQAATSSTVAAGIGELKELLDSRPDGTGFSFDDMAANIAGARFAEALLAMPPSRWAATAEAMEAEAVLLPPVEGLPSRLTEAEFRDRYGDVESRAYLAKIAEIEAAVDALPLYGPVLN